MSSVWYDDAALAGASAVAAAIAVEAITEIIVASDLFAPLRARLGRMVLPVVDDDKEMVVKPRFPYLYLFYKLLTCGYCCSVWVAALALLVMPGDVFGLLPWDNCVAKVFIVHRLANMIHTAYELARRGRVGTHDVNLSVIAQVDGGMKHQHSTDGTKCSKT